MMKKLRKPDEERRELVFNQINGFLEPDSVDGVKDESDCDRDIGKAVDRIYSAKARLCLHSGIDPDRDDDLNEMMDAFEDLCYQCGMLMYNYGWYDAQNR